MPFTLTMPKLSPTMEEGQIVKWHKKEGDFVEAGDLLMEVATDKATVEHEALDEGYLRKLIVNEGENAVVNQPIAIFTEEEKESIDGYEPEGVVVEKSVDAEEEEAETPAEKVAVPAKAGAGGAMHQPAFVPEPPLKNYSFEMPSKSIGKRVKASPLAKRLAKELGLDLTTVKGSGPGDRIMKKDLERAQPSGTVTFGHRGEPQVAPGSYEEIELSPMRKAISRRLQESKSFIPHFYVTQVVDMESLMSMREQLKSVGIKVSFNDFVIRACALALREHPGVNSGFNTVNQTIIQYKTIDVSVAVSIDEGLITPIVRHADYKNVGEISVEVKALANRAKEGKLQEHEYKGGSFTVSNLGMFGISHFGAIINPPQSCILAVGGIEEVPVVKKGQVVPGKTMTITLSVDHRVVDGVAAAEFIKTVQKFLENPASLIV